MAKMKVHELAKELEKQSKELIAFLQDKGYEVKAAQSSIEDEAIELVRKEFGSGTAKAAESKPEEAKAEPKKEMPKVEAPKAESASNAVQLPGANLQTCRLPHQNSQYRNGMASC